MVTVERGPSAALLALLAILSHCWILAMPFQGDDYLILPKVGEALGIEDPTPETDARADTQIGNFYLFRPVPWFVWWLTIEACGGNADPFIFHAMALLLHVVATLMLRAVLRPATEPRAAWLGAAFFAIAPGAVQATSFIAAGGDQYATIFTLGAAWCWQRHRRAPSALAVGGVAVCAALAVLSKEVAVASIPAVVLAAVAQPAARPGTWRAPIIAGAIGLTAAVVARRLYLGVWTPGYLTAVSLGVGDIARLPGLFLEFLAPWRRFDDAATTPPLVATAGERTVFGAWTFTRGAASIAFSIPLIYGLVARPVRTAPRLLLVALALGAMLVPALTIYDPSYTQVISRVFHSASALCGAAIAIGIAPACAPGRGRAMRAALLAPIVLLGADFMVHAARTELHVGGLIDARVESLRGVVADLPPDSHVVAVDGEYAVGGIPTLYFGVGPAMRPPFSREAARVTWWGDLTTLPRDPLLWRERRPIAVARVVEDRYVLRPPVVPGLPESLPDMVRAAPETTWRAGAPCPTRAIAGIRVTARSPGVVSLRWLGSRCAREARIAFRAVPEATAATIATPEDVDWLLDPVFVGVAFEGGDVSDVDVVDALPAIDVVAPAPRAHVAGGAVPEVVFAPRDGGSAAYRLSVEFAFHDRDRPLLVSEEPAFVTRPLGGGRVVYDLARQATARVVPAGPTDATTLAARLAEALETSGSGLVPISLRVEGVDPQSGAVESRSEWRVCFLRR